MLKIDDGFQTWLSDDSGPIRVHLARFTTFEAPREAIELNLMRRFSI